MVRLLLCRFLFRNNSGKRRPHYRLHLPSAAVRKTGYHKRPVSGEQSAYPDRNGRILFLTLPSLSAGIVCLQKVIRRLRHETNSCCGTGFCCRAILLCETGLCYRAILLCGTGLCYRKHPRIFPQSVRSGFLVFADSPCTAFLQENPDK